MKKLSIIMISTFWNKVMVRNAVVKKWITEKEYEIITKEAFTI